MFLDDCVKLCKIHFEISQFVNRNLYICYAIYLLSSIFYLLSSILIKQRYLLSQATTSARNVEGFWTRGNLKLTLFFTFVCGFVQTRPFIFSLSSRLQNQIVTSYKSKTTPTSSTILSFTLLFKLVIDQYSHFYISSASSKFL